MALPLPTYGIASCLIDCAANPAVQGGVKSADGKAVLVVDYIVESAAVRCVARITAVGAPPQPLAK
jgi:hypothetical protein